MWTMYGCKHCNKSEKHCGDMQKYLKCISSSIATIGRILPHSTRLLAEPSLTNSFFSFDVYQGNLQHSFVKPGLESQCMQKNSASLSPLLLSILFICPFLRIKNRMQCLTSVKVLLTFALGVKFFFCFRVFSKVSVHCVDYCHLAKT